MTKITIPTNNHATVRIPAKPAQPTEPIERIGVSVETAAEMLGVCISTMWQLAKEQKIHTVRVGKRVIFSVQSLRDFVNEKCEPADKSDIACVAAGKEAIYGNTNNR
jgi:excisionase family DNA binding protein